MQTQYNDFENLTDDELIEMYRYHSGMEVMYGVKQMTKKIL